MGRANLDGSGVDPGLVSPTTGPCGVAVDQVPAPPVGPPSNEFSFGKLKRNKKKGTAKLVVTVPGPGQIELEGKTVKPQRGTDPRAKPVAAAGDVTLQIKPKGKARKKLKKKGKAKVKVTVTFTPTGGTPNAQDKSLKLKKKRKKK